MIKFFIFITFFINFCTNLIANPNLSARTGILIDYDSDKILYDFTVKKNIRRLFGLNERGGIDYK